MLHSHFISFPVLFGIVPYLTSSSIISPSKNFFLKALIPPCCPQRARHLFFLNPLVSNITVIISPTHPHQGSRWRVHPPISPAVFVLERLLNRLCPSELSSSKTQKVFDPLRQAVGIRGEHRSPDQIERILAPMQNQIFKPLPGKWVVLKKGWPPPCSSVRPYLNTTLS